MIKGMYGKSPLDLQAGDRVKVNVTAEELQELQNERNAWDEEMAQVSLYLLNKHIFD